MKRFAGILVLINAAIFSSCAKRENADAAKSAAETPAAAPATSGPRAVVQLKDGITIPGTIVASSPTDVVVAGDDGIERKIPLTQVKSVEYGDSAKAAPASPAAQQATQSAKAVKETPLPRQQQAPPQASQALPHMQTQTPPQNNERPAPGPPPSPPPVTAKTYELPEGSEISVRTNEAIDSATANEGQTFDVQVTRDARSSDAVVVIPRGSSARVVIKSASKGGRFRGASDLVLDLQSVIIGGRSYEIDTVDISQKGKSGVGANKRTAEYTGGGAALGAIIGAIAGGGKGAAIGAGAGAGAGALTQILTKGGAIRVPVETVLTFSLDKPLRVTAVE
jgi:hypothetical protein